MSTHCPKCGMKLKNKWNGICMVCDSPLVGTLMHDTDGRHDAKDIGRDEEHMSQREKLEKLHRAGAITDDEYAFAIEDLEKEEAEERKKSSENK